MKDYSLYSMAAPKTTPEGCFVMMPFRSPFQEIYDDHIVPVMARMKVPTIRGDEIFSVQPITADIWSHICDAKFVIAELTGRNANVFYELGLAHAIGKPAILLAQDASDIPFDVRSIRTIIYDYTPRGCKKLEASLQSTVRELLLDIDSLRVGISGSYVEPHEGLRTFGQAIGRELAIRGFRMISGGGKGLSSDMCEGVRLGLSEVPIAPQYVLLKTYKPVGYTDVPPPPYGQVTFVGGDWAACCKVWLAEIDVLLVIHGIDKTRNEATCAIIEGIPVVAIGGTGGIADQLARESIGHDSESRLLSQIELPSLASLTDQQMAAIWAAKVADYLQIVVSNQKGGPPLEVPIKGSVKGSVL